MSYVIITEAQAAGLNGNYGIPRGIDNTYPAMVEANPLPDGMYILPELTSEILNDVNTELMGMVTSNNVQNKIPELPLVGEECIIGMIYNYSEGINGYSSLVKCVQTHNRTIYPPQETPALFSFFRENSDDLEWIPNELVELGWKRWYESKQYECLQAHQTLSTWTPDVTPALWKLVAPATNEWAYPVSYSVNQLVTYQGSTYKCLQAHTSQAGWTPPAVPALWQLV